MDQENDKTVGQISLELQQKTPDSIDPIEIERELHAEYDKNIFECVDEGKKEIFGDFYVVVITKKEPLMPNVLRSYFTSRKTCPTPDYDQTVYTYIAKDDSLEFMWVLPDKNTCEIMRDRALEIVPEERDLRDFVLSFYDKTLLRLAKKLNGEEDSSNILKK